MKSLDQQIHIEETAKQVAMDAVSFKKNNIKINLETSRRITESYSAGNVTGDTYEGGLIGWNVGTVESSFLEYSNKRIYRF
ncbi:hypothetical protein HRED_03784 [Candidatus Haloredivivus sp. G17]|nr:hypothetical protein HRED_03784 [Candidatus Haloredivivus sp. G17]